MIKLSCDEIATLITQNESEYLDFKKEFHSNNGKLIHDILCLANSICEHDKFIIFGIDNNKRILGIGDLNRRQSEIIDLLRNSYPNILPDILYYTEIINNHEIGILQIHNSEVKPYYLLKDKIENGFIVRAGVIYTRDKDTNTPINSTASISQIESLWRSHFGIDKEPLQQFEQYIRDLSGWKRSNETECYYSRFPNFKITLKIDHLGYSFFEYWVDKHSPSDLGNVEIHLIYNATILKIYHAIDLDSKIFFPVPRYYNLNDLATNGRAYIIKDNIVSYICAIITGPYSVDEYDYIMKNNNDINNPLDVFLKSLKIELVVHSLNIEFEDDNINPIYRFHD